MQELQKYVIDSESNAVLNIVFGLRKRLSLTNMYLRMC